MRASLSRWQTFQQAMNGGQVNHAFTVVGKEFIVFGEATIGTQPSKGALHDPPPGNDFKAFEVVTTQSNIDNDLFELLGDPLDKLATIAAVGPQALEACEQDGGQGLEQLNGGFAIAHIGNGHDDLEQIAQGIDQEVALASFDLFATVETPFPADCRRFDTLAVH